MASPELAQIVAMIRTFLATGDRVPDVGRLRAALDSLPAPAPRGTAISDVALDGLAAEWLVPPGADPDRRLLYLHGGAYVAGSRRSHRGLAARIGRAARCVVLLPEYRLAPEDPHPAAVHDALRALAWLRANAPDARRPARTLVVAGDSAGGGLTLATLIAARDLRLPLADAAVTISAWTDLALTGESLVSRAERDPMIPAALMHHAVEAYAKGVDARHPHVSPLYADFSGLPPLLMHVGDAEVLLDDSVRAAARAREHAVDVTLEVWPEMIHVWHMFSGLLPEGRQAIARIGEWVSERTE